MAHNNQGTIDKNLTEVSFKLKDVSRMMVIQLPHLDQKKQTQCINKNDSLILKLNDLKNRIESSEDIYWTELDQVEKDIEEFNELLRTTI